MSGKHHDLISRQQTKISRQISESTNTMDFLVRPNCYHDGLLRLGLAKVLLISCLLAVSTKVLVQGRLAAPSSQHHHDGPSSVSRRRQLQSSDVDYFDPQEGCTVGGPCQPWTTLFGSASSYPNRIVIDCAVCVTMNHTNFRLDDGMEIRGRLVVPDGTRLTMETTFLVVQGEFDITATQPVNGSPPVSITMIGDNDDQAFTFPSDPSQCTFDSSGCTIGQKGIVVAGGKLRGKNTRARGWPTYSCFPFCSSARPSEQHPYMGSTTRRKGRLIPQPYHDCCFERCCGFMGCRRGNTHHVPYTRMGSANDENDHCGANRYRRLRRIGPRRSDHPPHHGRGKL